MEILFDGKREGDITIGLFGKITPKAAENFRALCTGENGVNGEGEKLHFKGTKFYRIDKGKQLNTGDITKNDGSGGTSIYGPTFAKETNDLVQDTYAVGLTCQGDKVNSRFYILTSRQEWLDLNGLVIGRIVKGKQLVRKIEEQGGREGKPLRNVTIGNCEEVIDN